MPFLLFYLTVIDHRLLLSRWSICDFRLKSFFHSLILASDVLCFAAFVASAAV
jgi:hypothetical protein